MSGEITIPRFITRSFIASHRDYIFLFGSDVHGQTYVGQSAQARGEENAFGIVTKFRCCMQNNAFFYDEGYESITNGWLKEHIKALIDTSFSFIPLDGRPIIPFPKIGEGCSQLNTRAPKTLEYIKSKIAQIAYPNIKYGINS